MISRSPDEICRKCSAQQNELLYCARGGATVGCQERDGTPEHLHVKCARCRYPVRVRACDDA